MKSSAKNISLNSYDDIFSTEETREDAKREKVTDMPLSELHSFPDHPFQVRDDDAMKETVESIKEYGVLVPAIVRPRTDGGYELISGHRRKHACELAGLPTMPVIVRDLDDDAATIIMVDSNIQRENILPSERAKAYKMKLDAIRRQAGRPSKENSVQVGQNFQGKTSRDLLAENSPDSSTQIQRFIRLNELTPQLQQMVDDKKIAMTPAVELSYLKPEEQTLLLDTIESEQATPSLSQAQRLKNFSQEGHLNEDSMLAIMSEEKKPEKNDLTIKADKLQKYFPKSYTPQQMEQVIIRLLDGWQKKRQRDQER
ncbi:ParB/RepB/Spo0J family partition protein [Caproiciproducens sp. R1]|uniref:ParB/RepB/Spo0J family partition protein n=1 Tax=Caproiciproducens sp. R1 TaxID=3435000 RepID=UPI0040331C72